MNEVSYYDNDNEEHDESNEGNEAIGYFKDPIARKTSWKPLVKGGANFKTKKLVLAHPNRLVFKATIQMIIFGLVFVILGLLVAFFIGREVIFGAIFGFVFAAIGGGILYFSLTPIVIDKSLGYFWHCRKEPSGYRLDQTKYTPLKEIYAIQIISEYVQGSTSSSSGNRSTPYTSYEINFVMKDASRKNVIDHGNLASIKRDAKMLADFLDVPLWNQMEQRHEGR